MFRIPSSAITLAWCCLSSSLALALPAAEIASRVQTPLTPVYEARQFAPLWLDENKPSVRAEQAMAIMARAADDGLDPATYDLPALQKQIDNLKAHNGSDQEQAAFDLALSNALLRYIEDLAVGQVSPQKLGFAINTSARQARFQNSLADVLTASNMDEAVNHARPVLPTYAALRQQLGIYRALAEKHPHAPELPALPGKKLSPGDAWTGTQVLADWLVILGYMPAGTTVTTQYDGELVAAVENFQRHHGQIADGVIGKQTYQNLHISLPARVQQIELAMERLRWLDDSILSHRFIVINVPQFTLWAFAPSADGKPEQKLQMAVVVGQAGKTETPLMTKNLSSLVFSPYWNVPRSIAIKELLPKLHNDPGYLIHENMELVDNNGNVHSSYAGPAELHGIAAGQYRIRQRPGLKNALGELKFVFPNDDSIYMHDTPSKPYFAKERRDLSHGCVRLQNPMGLALFALETQGEWDEARVREKISIGTEQHMALKERMPVLLLYLTANVNENGDMVFLPDIYKQDSKLAAAMQQSKS